MFWEHEVAGSNPATPTTIMSFFPYASQQLSRLLRWGMEKTMKKTTQLLKGNWPPILVLFLLFGYLLMGFNKGLSIYDEGLAVYGSDRILHGDLPYKDFWTLYGPASFYALAGLFKLFGSSLLVERFYALGIVVAVVLLSYIIAARFASPGLSLIAPACAAVWLYTPGRGPDDPAMVFTLLSLLFLLNYFSTKRRSWLYPAGLSIGIIFLFRHDQGAMICAAALILSILHTAIGRGQEKSVETRPMRSLKAAACILSGAALVVIPVAVWLLKSVPTGYLAEMLFVYPLKVYPAVRFLPLPAPIMSPSALSEGLPLVGYIITSINQIQFYYPIVVCGMAAVVLARMITQRKIALQYTDLFALAALLTYGLCSIARVMTRADNVHLRGAIVMASILMPAIACSMSGSKKLKSALWALVVLTGFAPIAFKAAASVCIFVDERQNDFSFSIDRARGIHAVASFAEYEDLVRYVQVIVPAGEKIFVGNLRHDLIFLNDSMLYFLADRQSATRYNELDPGVANTELVQRQIIADLKGNDVKVVVLREPITTLEPNAAGKSTGVVILDQFLRKNFSPAEQFGPYLVCLSNASYQ